MQNQSRLSGKSSPSKTQGCQQDAQLSQSGKGNTRGSPNKSADNLDAVHSNNRYSISRNSKPISKPLASIGKQFVKSYPQAVTSRNFTEPVVFDLKQHQQAIYMLQHLMLRGCISKINDDEDPQGIWDLKEQVRDKLEFPYNTVFVRLGSTDFSKDNATDDLAKLLLDLRAFTKNQAGCELLTGDKPEQLVRELVKRHCYLDFSFSRACKQGSNEHPSNDGTLLPLYPKFRFYLANQGFWQAADPTIDSSQQSSTVQQQRADKHGISLRNSTQFRSCYALQFLLFVLLANRLPDREELPSMSDRGEQGVKYLEGTSALPGYLLAAVVSEILDNARAPFARFPVDLQKILSDKECFRFLLYTY